VAANHNDSNPVSKMGTVIAASVAPIRKRNTTARVSTSQIPKKKRDEVKKILEDTLVMNDVSYEM
jgi:hypothetical protein